MKDVFVNIKGIYRADGEQSTAELFTRGRMCEKDGHYYVMYQESETTGFDGCKTSLKIEQQQNRVTMERRGDATAYLVLHKGMRNIGRYHFYDSEMDIGVYASEVDIDFHPNGGRLKLSYSLDMNSSLISENELEIEVSPDEAAGKDVTE